MVTGKDAKEAKPNHSGLIVLLLFLVIAAMLGSVYFYFKYQEAKSQTTTTSPQEVQQLLVSVGKLMVLPQESPTVATVSDINKLKGQIFFKQAQNGDKVLIFPKNREAILYRPSLGKIIAVSTVSVEGSSVPVKPSVAALPPVKVELLNGTDVVGLTSTAEKKLTASDTALTVTDRQNAARDTYTKTIVVDMTGETHAQDAARIADALRGTVGKLPKGEIATKSADILVILGKDFAAR